VCNSISLDFEARGQSGPVKASPDRKETHGEYDGCQSSSTGTSATPFSGTPLFAAAREGHGVVIENGRVRRMKKTDYLRDSIYQGLYDRNPAYDIDPDDDDPEPDLPGLAS
jgi:hypothetical protein